jgi:hypothetical protein
MTFIVGWDKPPDLGRNSNALDDPKAWMPRVHPERSARIKLTLLLAALFLRNFTLKCLAY